MWIEINLFLESDILDYTYACSNKWYNIHQNRQHWLHLCFICIIYIGLVNIEYKLGCLYSVNILASGPTTLKFSQICDFSEDLSFSHPTVPPNILFLKLRLVFKFFFFLNLRFLQRACHQCFFRLSLEKNLRFLRQSWN